MIEGTAEFNKQSDMLGIGIGYRCKKNLLPGVRSVGIIFRLQAF